MGSALLTLYTGMFLMGIVCVADGVVWVLLPVRRVRWGRGIWRRLRLISADKLNKPMSRRRAFLGRVEGLACVLIGMLLLWQIDVQVALVEGGPLAASPPSGALAYLAPKVAHIVRGPIASGSCVGMSVGLIRQGDELTLSYGRMGKDKPQAPSADTLYEIGSVTKVFTALLLADMAEKRELRLSDPVAKYLPVSTRLPQRDGREIQLVDLACHHSGLPRMPGNMVGIADLVTLRFICSPYARYSTDDLYEFLSGCVPKAPPGSSYEYSNLGAALLGHALARCGGHGYEDLVIERICRPLGLEATRVRLDAGQKERLAPAYAAGVRVGAVTVYLPAENWSMPSFEGAGALCSTTDDLLRFLAANLHPEKTSLEPAILRSHVVLHQVGANLGVAMGWHVGRIAGDAEAVYWHNGGTGGYASFIAFSPKHQVGVVVLSNSSASVDEIGRSVLSLLVEDTKLREHGSAMGM